MLLLREGLLNSLEVEDIESRLIITPLLDKKAQVGACSIDLRLGSGFIETRQREAHVIDPFAEEPLSVALIEERYNVPIGESFYLHPNQFVLGSTFEYIRLPAHLGGQILGRSSWGRLGLIVATAVTVQPGYGGCLTLELRNLGSVPIRLFPGLRIAQLMIWSAEHPTESPYSESPKYHAPLGPETSRIGWEKQEVGRLQAIGQALRGGLPS